MNSWARRGGNPRINPMPHTAIAIGHGELPRCFISSPGFLSVNTYDRAGVGPRVIAVGGPVPSSHPRQTLFVSRWGPRRILAGDAVAFFRAVDHVLGKPKESVDVSLPQG